MIEIPFNPDFSEQMDRTNSHGDHPCIVCGRKCRNPRYQVYVNSGFSHILNTEEIAQDEGEMGWFPVGPDCLKKHPELRSYVRASEKDKAKATETLLQQYRAGKLSTLWNAEKADMMQRHPELHETTNGDMAAAKIAVLAGREVAALESLSRQHCGNLDAYPEQCELYDRLFMEENYHLRSELIDMSGCRAICTYEQDFIDGIFE